MMAMKEGQRGRERRRGRGRGAATFLVAWSLCALLGLLLLAAAGPLHAAAATHSRAGNSSNRHGVLVKTQDGLCRSLERRLSSEEEALARAAPLSPSIKCATYRPYVASNAATEEDSAEGSRVVVHERPIHVNLPVALASVSVRARVRREALPLARRISLRADPLASFRRGLPVPRSRTTLLELAGADADGADDPIFDLLASTAAGQGREGREGDEAAEWVEVAWSSAQQPGGVPPDHGLRNLTALASLDPREHPAAALRRQWEVASPNATSPIASNAALRRYLASHPWYHAGNGGALGIWSLVAESEFESEAFDPSAPERLLVEDWSLEVCFDARRNYRTMCSGHAGFNATEDALWQEREGKGGEGPRVEAMARARGPVASAACRVPGLRAACGAMDVRVRDDVTCAEAAYSWNPFTRLNQGYCCRKSRVLFWRHWFRKNLTGRCRRFFRNN